ncbi:MAG: sulfotransferase family 2 domain-containing protein [Chthoniobacterales bacterium]|nr:sulfotransferase family 2 domain-containing protein [Chthoniobacterales bacterium]
MNTSTTIPDHAVSPHEQKPGESVIFLHVPKTAGTTLNRLIEWEYPVLQMYSVDPVLFKWSSKHLHGLSKKRLEGIRMFKGHMLFGLHIILPQSATYITVLREPVDRVLSAYYFMRSYKLHPLYWKFRRENWTLEDFVHRSPRTNVQCKIIAGAEYEAPCTAEICATAMSNIDRHFSVVGLSERFEESLALMKLRYGWKLETYSSFNVTRARPKKRDLPQSTLDLITEKNSYDVSLYAYAAKRFEEEVSQNAAEVARITADLQASRDRTQAPMTAKLFALRSAGRKALNRVYSAI